MPPFSVMQRHGKDDPAATNTRKNRTIVERLCLAVFSLIVARYQLGKDILAATKNCLIRILFDHCRIKG
jgi:hypothetical protein